MSLISSPQNDRVKLVRQLQRQVKARRKQRQVVLEGVRLVRDAWENGTPPEFVMYEDAPRDPVPDLISALAADGITCLRVTAALMREMADTDTPQGILGVFPWPDLPIPAAPRLVVVADGWRDPGNLGTLIRTAAAAGVDLVALTPGTVDPLNPKAIRAGMGAQFRVPVAAFEWDDLAERLNGLAVYLADAAGDVVYTAVDWAQPSAVVIGGEAHGLRDTLHTLDRTTLVRIPMAPGAESLNAAVAAAILIYAAYTTYINSS